MELLSLRKGAGDEHGRWLTQRITTVSHGEAAEGVWMKQGGTLSLVAILRRFRLTTSIYMG